MIRARHGSMCFTWDVSFHTHTNPMGWALLSLNCKWGSWGTGRLRRVLKDGGARVASALITPRSRACAAQRPEPPHVLPCQPCSQTFPRLPASLRRKAKPQGRPTTFWWPQPPLLIIPFTWSLCASHSSVPFWFWNFPGMFCMRSMHLSLHTPSSHPLILYWKLISLNSALLVTLCKGASIRTPKFPTHLF